MKHYIVFSFLLRECVFSARAGQVSRSGTGGTDIILSCENDEKGSWSKRTEDGRVDLYILQNKEDTTVYKRAPDDRYTVLPDSTLMIKNLSLSDSGIYYYNGYPVLNLTVAPSSAAFSQSRTEGRNIRLPCDYDGKVSWTKHTDDKNELFMFNEVMQDAYICEPDPDKRYIILPDLSLLIKKALVSDTGLYHCGGDRFFNLTVKPSKALSESLMHTYTSSMNEATVNATEGGNIILHCEAKGQVLWSKHNNDGWMNLYIVYYKSNLIICKLDLDKHFKILPDSSLTIRNVSLSDSGTYFCNDSPVVNLTITPISAEFHQTRSEGTNSMLYCYSLERAFWTKRTNEDRLDVIFTQDEENTLMYKRDPDKRYVILSNSSLMISNASVSDSGIYYCKHSPAANLIIFPLKGGVSEVERGLMFGGVALAFLSFSWLQSLQAE